MKKIGFIFLFFLLMTGCTQQEKKITSKDFEESFKITKIIEHHKNSFTEGFWIEDQFFYESAGKYGESLFYQWSESGEIEKKKEWDSNIFLEGSTSYQNHIYILTYKENKGYQLSKETWEIEKEYDYPREGWGLTTDGEYLIASDGSTNLYFLDKELKEKKVLKVTENGNEIKNINELEYIHDKIWANIWLENTIVIINPKTGEVEEKYNFDSLIEKYLKEETIDWMNGIAYDKKNNKIWITGKYWPYMFELERK